MEGSKVHIETPGSPVFWIFPQLTHSSRSWTCKAQKPHHVISQLDTAQCSPATQGKRRSPQKNPQSLRQLTAPLRDVAPHPSRSSHTGLLTLPRVLRARSCLRACTRAAPSAWSTRPPTPRGAFPHLLRVEAEMSPPRRSRLWSAHSRSQLYSLPNGPCHTPQVLFSPIVLITS